MEGLDYELADVDYDEIEAKLLRDTFDTNIREENMGLWDYLDYSFDMAARDPIDLSVEADYRVAEDYCKEMGIGCVPPLYQAMFDAGVGFMSMAKMPYYMDGLWKARFPEPIIGPYRYPDDKTLKMFHDYINRNKTRHIRYGLTLRRLEHFICIATVGEAVSSD